MRVAVLIASYNRVSITLRGLDSLHIAFSGVPSLDLHVFLVDDASPDETGKFVKERFPNVVVIMGTGQLYWNGGMCRAFAAARDYGRFDAYLLYNDDVEVIPSAIRTFIDEYKELNRNSLCILAGATISARTGVVSYGGFRQLSRFRALSFARVPLTGKIEDIDTFNGNCVLVPGPFFEQVGGPDPAYVQYYADIDLGLVATRYGVAVKLWRQPVGYCESDESGANKRGSWLFRLRASFGGTSSLREYLHFVIKHRMLWLLPIYAAQSIIRRFLKSLK